MQQFYRVSDGSLPNIHEIREQNPGVGIPNAPEDLSDLGYEKYIPIDKPTVNSLQTITEGPPVKNANDVWETNWIIGEKSPQEASAVVLAVKAQKWEEIKAERDRRTQSGVKVGTKWFHSDSASRIQQLGLKDRGRDILAAGGVMSDPIMILGQPVQWQTLDGTAEPMTVQLAFDIVAAIGDLDALLFYTAKTHNAAMSGSANPETYDIMQGWPKTYGEP